MSLREALLYIRTHHREHSKAELMDELQKMGYAEDEIEEAFMMALQTEPLFREKEKDKEITGAPNLINLMEERVEAAAHKSWLDAEGVKGEKRVRKKGEFFVGIILPLIIYSFGLLLVSPRGTPFPPSVSIQVTVIGVSGALALVGYVWLRKSGFDFIRGLPYGVLTLITLGFAAIAAQFFSEFFSRFTTFI